MPRPKKGTKSTETQGQNEPTGISKLYALRGKDLISQISQKCLYLPQLMTSRKNLLDSLLEQRWQQMVNDRLHKYPYPPSSKLFNKISQECWNEIYRQNEENEACFRNFQLTEEGLMDEIRKISAQLASIEQTMASFNCN